MTVYWVTIAAIGYLVLMTRALEPALDARPLGKFPVATSSRILLASAAAVLILVAGLRWRVGTDFGQYALNYDAYKRDFFEDLMIFDEPGIKGIAWLVAHIRDDSAVFMFVASAITVGLMLWTITRYSIALAMSYLLFIFVGAWHGSFNGVRQFLAASIVLVGHRLIVARRPLWFLLAVLMAAAFHVSAFAALALYLVPRGRLGPRTLFALALFSLGALYASDAVLGIVQLVKEDLTLTSYVTTSINPLRIAVAMAPMLLYWSQGMRTEADGEWFYRNMAVIHAVVMLAASWSAYLGRFGIYTTVFLPLVLPRLVDFPDRRMTALVRASVVLLFAAFWYVEVSGSPDLNTFQFVFERQEAG